MNIQEIREKFKGVCTNEEYRITGLIIAVSVCSFVLGRFSAVESTVTALPGAERAISVQQANIQQSERIDNIETDSSEPSQYVASKSGTKYHLPWCPGAKQIKETNKIYFVSKEDAERAGYAPASNCKGI